MSFVGMLRAEGVELRVNHQGSGIQFRPTEISDELRELIRLHRDAILAELRAPRTIHAMRSVRGHGTPALTTELDLVPDPHDADDRAWWEREGLDVGEWIASVSSFVTFEVVGDRVEVRARHAYVPPWVLSHAHQLDRAGLLAPVVRIAAGVAAGAAPPRRLGPVAVRPNDSVPQEPSEQHADHRLRIPR